MLKGKKYLLRFTALFNSEKVYGLALRIPYKGEVHSNYRFILPTVNTYSADVLKPKTATVTVKKGKHVMLESSTASEKFDYGNEFRPISARLVHTEPTPTMCSEVADLAFVLGTDSNLTDVKVREKIELAEILNKFFARSIDVTSNDTVNYIKGVKVIKTADAEVLNNYTEGVKVIKTADAEESTLSSSLLMDLYADIHPVSSFNMSAVVAGVERKTPSSIAVLYIPNSEHLVGIPPYSVIYSGDVESTISPVLKLRTEDTEIIELSNVNRTAEVIDTGVEYIGYAINRSREYILGDSAVVLYKANPREYVLGNSAAALYKANSRDWVYTYGIEWTTVPATFTVLSELELPEIATSVALSKLEVPENVTSVAPGDFDVPETALSIVWANKVFIEGGILYPYGSGAVITSEFSMGDKFSYDYVFIIDPPFNVEKYMSEVVAVVDTFDAFSLPSWLEDGISDRIIVGKSVKMSEDAEISFTESMSFMPNYAVVSAESTADTGAVDANTTLIEKQSLVVVGTKPEHRNVGVIVAYTKQYGFNLAEIVAKAIENFLEQSTTVPVYATYSETDGSVIDKDVIGIEHINESFVKIDPEFYGVIDFTEDTVSNNFSLLKEDSHVDDIVNVIKVYVDDNFVRDSVITVHDVVRYGSNEIDEVITPEYVLPPDYYSDLYEPEWATITKDIVIEEHELAENYVYTVGADFDQATIVVDTVTPKFDLAEINVYSGYIELEEANSFIVSEYIKPDFATITVFGVVDYMEKAARVVVATIVRMIDSVRRGRKRLRIVDYDLAQHHRAEDPGVTPLRRRWVIQGKPQSWNIWPWRKTK